MSIWTQLWSWLRGRASHQIEPPAGDVGKAEARACAGCRYFQDDPAAIEAALPGLSSLSSGYASVRGHDGLCLKHDRFVTARSSCPLFRAPVARAQVSRPPAQGPTR